MDEFFAKYEYIMPWLIRNSPDPEKEIIQSPKERKKIDMPVDCILCGCCYSSCPSAWGEENYLGPAALLKAHRFEVDTRDEARKERLPRLDNERGVYRCHTIMNCVEACPKELNPTEGIQWLKKTAVRRRLFGKAQVGVAPRPDDGPLGCCERGNDRRPASAGMSAASHPDRPGPSRARQQLRPWSCSGGPDPSTSSGRAPRMVDYRGTRGALPKGPPSHRRRRTPCRS